MKCVYFIDFFIIFSCVENKLCFQNIWKCIRFLQFTKNILSSQIQWQTGLFLHQIECCKIQFTSIKLNLVLSKQKLIVDKYSRYRQAESIRLKFVSGYHISLILCIQDHPNYQNIQNMACPPYRCQTKEFSGD